MHKIKHFISKHSVILISIGAILASLALIKLPNLSTLAFESITPQSEMTKKAHNLKHHWGNQLDDASPVDITYSVPIEFSKSQKIRLASKERWLIQHKHALKIYRITSCNTSPFAKQEFHGKNWYKIQLWIPTQLINNPLFQARLRHYCALSGITTKWHNPINEQYQKLTAQWYQQKIVCVWILIVCFLTLLTSTTILKSLLIIIADLELSIISLSLITNLMQTCYFYLPLMVVLIISLFSIILVIQKKHLTWLTKLNNPMQNWHPLISLFLSACLIFPLLTYAQIKMQQPPKQQNVTVYLTNNNVINYADLNRLTNQIKSIKNVSHVSSLTQPAGFPIQKYQFKTALSNIQHNFKQQQKVIHNSTTNLNQVTNNQAIDQDLKNQAEQIKQLQKRHLPDTESFIDYQTKLNQNLQHNHALQTDDLIQIKNKLTRVNPTDEINAISEIKEKMGTQFYLSTQDTHDSDFSQLYYNFNNEKETATRIEITLCDGKLGNLSTQIQNMLIGTKFQRKIGMEGLPVNYNLQQQKFYKTFPIILGICLLILLMISSYKSKSINMGLISIFLFIIASFCSLGALYHFNNYQFTPLTSYLIVGLLVTIALLPSEKKLILLMPTLLIPILFSEEIRFLSLFLITFIIIYHIFLKICLKISKQKRLLNRSLLSKYIF